MSYIHLDEIPTQSTLCFLHRTNSFYKDFFFFRPQSHISRDVSVTPSNIWSVGKVYSLMLTSISLWPPLVFMQDADLPKNTRSKHSAKIKTAANASRCTAYFFANNFSNCQQLPGLLAHQLETTLFSLITGACQVVGWEGGDCFADLGQ